jgi:hypothetical protein
VTVDSKERLGEEGNGEEYVHVQQHGISPLHQMDSIASS